ncbi:MAG: adenylate/guanylate cyclase domain-containing protein [Burkholderiales bacterium]|nr:adenylate/guanylate cyclase domain-containing protein [Burkholderiales bacterium]
MTTDTSSERPVALGSALDSRISGSFRNRFEQELFRNSGQFPIANLLLELLLEGPAVFLAPDVYTLIGAMLLQAWVLTRWKNTAPRRFLGNLVGPAAYTAVEACFEGWEFFAAPNHIAYWIFAIAIGALQAARSRAGPGPAAGVLVVLENVVRAAILFVMYAIFELLVDGTQFSAAAFFADRAHLFIGLATLILGISVGLAALSEYGYLALLRETSTQLQRYSEWLLGRDLLERVIANPEALTMVRRERAILFMDIRGFTAWSERRSPETVVQALNGYYQAAEPVVWRHGAIKMKFSADEVLAVFAEPRQAAACAMELRTQTRQALSSWELGAGIGVHSGPVVEGLLGSSGIKGYDVIGDTVNTAKRIEGAAGGGEALVSESVRAALDPGTPLGERRELVVKGKEAPLAVYPLL